MIYLLNLVLIIIYYQFIGDFVDVVSVEAGIFAITNIFIPLVCIPLLVFSLANYFKKDKAFKEVLKPLKKKQFVPSNQIYVLNWLFGGGCLLIGLLLGVASVGAGLSLIMISLLLFPPFRKFAYSKTNKEIPIKIRAAAIIALIVTFFVFVLQDVDKEFKGSTDQTDREIAENIVQIEQEHIDYFTANREQIILSAKAEFEDKEYELVLAKTNKYLVSGDKILEEINSSAEIEINKIRKINEEIRILEKLKGIPGSKYQSNINEYAALVRLFPNNKRYKTKLAMYKEKRGKQIKKNQLEKSIHLKHRNQEHGNKNKKLSWMSAGKIATKAKLKDSSSAEFRNVYFNRGSDNIPMTCGEVNSKNSFGSYTGYQRFVSAGKSELTFLEEQVPDFNTVWNRFCK